MARDVDWDPARESGDPELVRQVKRAGGAPGAFHTLSVVLVDAEGVRFAALGTRRPDAAGPAGPDTAFEIGSVTKPLTGMLLASLAGSGAVSPGQPVAELLPGRTFASAETAAVTLEELASHRSGLPRLHWPASLWTGLRLTLAVRRGKDPYAGMGVEDFLVRATALTPVGPRGTFAYSNLGMALLGQALAAACAGDGGGYPALLRRELLDPLGMDATRVRTRGEPVGAGAAPHLHSGRAAAPWASAGYAPAGTGVWSTARDLSRLLVAQLAGRAPGSDAALPRHEANGDNRIGYGWMTLPQEGREITWHNGATGGSCSFVGYDRAAGRAVAVLSNMDQGVDTLGLRLVLATE